MSWNELSLKDKADYIKESVNNGIYNLSDIRNRYNIYANGGYKPSESIKKRITNWEGSSMRTNRSFQAEANDFNRVIPSSIRSKLSQQQLDALYSYGYNVGMGNLKKRVLPTLTNYVQGKASNEDVQKSMWASKDNELRGLTTRRNIERSLFGGKYQTVFTGTGGTPHNYGYIATNTNRSSSNPYQIQNEEWQNKNYLDAYKGLQLSMNDIMGKTKEDDIDDLFSTGTGPTISMENLLSIGNNNVAPVQPDYSYAKSLLSDFDSDLNSNMFGNGGKIPKTYQGDLSHLKDVGYQKWRANLPTNLREETSDYNLYEAYKSGAKPRLESDGYYHLPSRDPRTNKILKKPTHPTYGMALREDAVEGYLPIYKNGETYTYPLPWIKADGGKLNIFDEGGNLNFIDADNRRSNILLHTKDGNLYDSTGNNYTQSYLDEEHIPIIKGTMPRNTRQYYDPNTTLEFINAATAPISNFMPSNIVGSIREARDYNTFMNSFMNQDNTGFFTREYAKEHPYISTLGNIGGDILTGVALNKEYNIFKNSINSRINKSISNEASDIYGKELSDKLKEGYFNFTKGKEIPITLNENSFRSAKQIPLVMEEKNEFKNFPIGEYTSKRVKDYYKDVMTPLMEKQGIIAPEKLKSAVLTVPENPTDWNGFYNYYTGIPYLKVKAKNGNLLAAIKNGDFNSTYLHEAASHGTDKQVLNNFLRDFYDFNTFLPKDYNWNPMIKASRDKEEFRATMNQVRDKILDSYYIINGKYPKEKDLEKAVDNRDMNLIMNMFYTTNAYGKDYYNAYQDLLKRGNKQDLINFENEIRRSLKYFPAIGAGVTLINNSKVK